MQSFVQRNRSKDDKFILKMQRVSPAWFPQKTMLNDETMLTFS